MISLPENEFDENAYNDLKNAVGPALQKITETFLSNSKEDFAALQTHFSNDDLDATSRAAHKLKSSSGYLGLKHVSNLAKEIEFGAREGKPAEDLAALVQKMREALSSAWVFLESGTH
ncbi:MAG: Hpt domain-containing protein [Rhodospirillales bacterium]|nr:Hpt domain-containing protein [Alphaproteobacteria bacterium]USO04431.1 MAG: Hpt domain-containing protein [Rhodospirillales bacterium]